MISRRAFLGALAGTGVLLTARLHGSLPVAGRLPKLRLGFFTDVHARPDGEVPEALRLAAEVMKAERVDHWVCGGDVIHGGHTTAAKDCEPSFEVYRSFLDRLGQPVAHVVGNHDLAGALPQDGSPSANDPRALWRQTVGQKDVYRTLDLEGVRIFFLDSVEVVGGPSIYRGFVGPEQVDWIRRELEKTPRDQPLVLATHIPFRTTFYQEVEGPTTALPENLVVANANEVLALFKDHNLILVLQGHLHSNELIDWAGRRFLMGGAISGAWWRGPHRQTDFGYGIVEFADGRIDWTYKGYGWAR